MTTCSNGKTHAHTFDQPNRQFRQHLKNKGYTLVELAKGCGVHQTTLSTWLRMPISDECRVYLESAIERLDRGEIPEVPSKKLGS